jgi:hypothetical protein
MCANWGITRARDETGGPHRDPAAMMPGRKTTRAQSRERYIAAERGRNQQARNARKEVMQAHYFNRLIGAPEPNEEPPPF